MDIIVKGCKVLENGALVGRDIRVSDGLFAEIAPDISCDGGRVVEFNNCVLFPGFADVHVHLREPGFSYKEDMKSGTAAAAAGGYTTVCAMPNLNPVPDCAENLKAETDAISKGALIEVLPYGALTVSEKGEKLSKMEEIADFVCAFSDDGKGVQSGDMMRAAMEKAKSLGKMVVAHCEDESLLRGGYIHDGEYAKKNGHRGICSKSEWAQIERDIKIAEKTGCAYHVCHVSAKESVELIRAAQARGVNVTCETCPHYLILTDEDLKDEGRFKMNPPIRGREDKDALLRGIKDGTVSMIVTDHAPHSAEEKSRGLRGSLMGVVGLETAFPILYTYLVKTGEIELGKLIDLMSANPRKRFNLGGGIEVGKRADFTVFDLDEKYIIDHNSFRSKGRATPFEGFEVYGKCKMTVYSGDIVFE